MSKSGSFTGPAQIRCSMEYLSICLSIYLSIYLSIFLSLYMYICRLHIVGVVAVICWNRTRRGRVWNLLRNLGFPFWDVPGALQNVMVLDTEERVLVCQAQGIKFQRPDGCMSLCSWGRAAFTGCILGG